jgi:hypothetical protein
LAFKPGDDAFGGSRANTVNVNRDDAHETNP